METRATDQARTLTKREHIATELLSGLMAKELDLWHTDHWKVPMDRKQSVLPKTAVRMADLLIEELNKGC